MPFIHHHALRAASHRPSTSRRARDLMDILEPRTLLSATWSTIFSDPGYFEIQKLTADRNGNVYALAQDQNFVDVILEKTSGSAQWSPIYRRNTAGFMDYAMAVDPAGDLFIGGRTSTASGGTWSIMERRAGQTSFSTIDSLSAWPSACYSLTTDAAGDVYAGGYDYVTTTTTVKDGKKTTTTTTKTQYTVFRKLTPTATGYSAATLYHAPGGSISNIVVIESGNNAGIYALGGSIAPSTSGSQAIKSTDGGATWSTIVPSLGPVTNTRFQIASDLSGNLYISGWRTGTSLSNSWTVHESTDGGATWSVVDDFINPGSTMTQSYAMGTDLQGNVYVLGFAELTIAPPYQHAHGIIRTNVGGTWQTVDDIPYVDYYQAFTVDSTGTLYAAGQLYAPSTPNGEQAFIRSAPGPAPLLTLTRR